MSFVTAAPEFVSAAASDLASIGSTISAANATAAAPTTGVLAAGADEVSAAVAGLFGAHAQGFQAVSAQASAFHNQFVQLLNGGAGQYAAAEAANASPLQTAAAAHAAQPNTTPGTNLGNNNQGSGNVGNGNTGSGNVGGGNTGNSNAPHLHFQLMNGPSLLEADGLPYLLDSFGYQGQVDPASIANADNYLSGSYFGPGRLPTAQPRTNQLPVSLALVNFPS